MTICGQIMNHLEISCRFCTENNVIHENTWSLLTLWCALKPQQEAVTNSVTSSILYTAGVRALYLVTTARMTLYKEWKIKLYPSSTYQWKCFPWSDSASNPKQENSLSMLQAATAGFTELPSSFVGTTQNRGCQ